MKSLDGKKILLGVCGSIAAYKAVYFLRLLVKAGAEVQVVMTPSAASFVAPLTFSVLSKRPALMDYINAENHSWNNHVELGMWPDLMVVAPASANTIAKMASGMADNLLLATYLSARAPVMLAPAMDLDMYRHPASTENIEKLKNRGHIVLPPAEGELASGLSGEGRLPEAEELFGAVLDFFFDSEAPLSGKKVVITAGPTVEDIDPVRFISNYSSGKMGYELARELKNQGAEITLIKGPTTEMPPEGMHRLIEVKSAREMHDAALKYFPDADIFIGAAAVADYRPKNPSTEKIKKSGNAPVLELVENPDIIASVDERKRADQIVVGFALESENAVENAKIKLKKKNLDFIVLNSLEDPGAGFQSDSNKITIIDRENNFTNFELKPKREVAADIVQYLIKYIHAKA